MSAEDLITSFGKYATAALFNRVRSILSGDILPRNLLGQVQDCAGSLGAENFEYLKAHVRAGDLFPGAFLTSFDANSAPQGYMECDGRIINKENYDAEHGAGTWETYIGSSVLEGRYLPNLNDLYTVGGDTQEGTAPITTVGNPGHQVDLSHTHSGVTGPSTLYENVQRSTGSVVSGYGHTHNFSTGQADIPLSLTLIPKTLTARTFLRII
ncbi:MAG: hypothetical protein A2428_03150 [Bdellovibrionales bacterium RIFOXYC1_FULL_54_43]|nr:MAG: hypothetical protein A2428_03150 [Bdellovibrionales bacterium RIFOXYC1_FULL_54_43]OFZ82678.1 MAG: hypothetical protein A2603_02585 [Bdellovibrionales bacterium RIFOXYD1_FULL_55_31]